MLRLVLAALLLAFVVSPLSAEEIAVGDGYVVSLVLAEGWSVHTRAPEALIAEIAEHVEHEAVAQGYDPSPDQLREAALKRLNANEAIVYHAASKSHIDIDFSAIGPKDKVPTLKTLKGSAGYALQSLEGEEGVSGLTHAINVTNVAGAGDAARLEASYRHHDEPVNFIGIIGYVDRAWFFLYATSFGDDPAVQAGAAQILDSIKISRN